MRILFFHGLNTYGDDLLHFGPVTLGPMAGPLSEAFAAKGRPFTPVRDLGAHPPEVQAERGWAWLESRHPELLEETDWCLLGQSTGGLTARAFAALPQARDRVKSVITIGSPHHGAAPAEFGVAFRERYPTWQKIVAACGYDTSRREAIFAHLTAAGTGRFNTRFPALPGLEYAHALCLVTPSQLSWPLRFFYERWGRPADGFISAESQAFGISLGTFALDHFGEVGYFLQASPAARRAARVEFLRFVETVDARLEV